MALPPLAEVDDVEQAWRPLDDNERGQAEHVLRLAQALVRTEVPAVDRRVDAGELDPELVRDVVVAMTLRSLRNPDNARGRSRSAGPFTEYTQWDATSIGVLLLDSERRLLAPARRRGSVKGFGSLRLSAGLGFPPAADYPTPPPPPPGGVVAR